jgi:hypothetical protein
MSNFENRDIGNPSSYQALQTRQGKWWHGEMGTQEEGEEEEAHVQKDMWVRFTRTPTTNGAHIVMEQIQESNEPHSFSRFDE